MTIFLLLGIKKTFYPQHLRGHETILVNIANTVEQVRDHIDICVQYLAGYTHNTQAKDKC